MDLQQGYNNVQIKEKDEWKAAFMILEGVFELTINIRKVVSFMNNVIVGTEEEKEHDKIVKEVVRRLVENDLYIKLEKYK